MDNPALLEIQDTVQKSHRFLLSASALIVLLTVAALGTYIWFTLHSACEVNAVQEASALLVSHLDRYDHAYQFATTVSRTGLDRPVIVLQQIFLDTRDIVVPACMQTAKNELVSYMGTVIRAFQAYRAAEKEATVTGLLDQSATHYNNFRTELEAVNQCAPFCIPSASER